MYWKNVSSYGTQLQKLIQQLLSGIYSPSFCLQVCSIILLDPVDPLVIVHVGKYGCHIPL